jgi:ketosteroid isomerase-like protein
MANTTTNPGKDDAATKELIELERRYWRAVKDHDVEEAVRLTADPCILSGATGVARFGHEAFRAMWAGAATYTLDRFRIGDDVQVHMLSDDIAVVAYSVHEDLTVEGTPVALDAAETSTWVRRDGRWVCAVHTEALRGDAFGRDREATKGGAASA